VRVPGGRRGALGAQGPAHVGQVLRPQPRRASGLGFGFQKPADPEDAVHALRPQFGHGVAALGLVDDDALAASVFSASRTGMTLRPSSPAAAFCRIWVPGGRSPRTIASRSSARAMASAVRGSDERFRVTIASVIWQAKKLDVINLNISGS